MPGFDPSTAVAFDPTSAKPVDFDPTTAKPAQTPSAPRPAGASGFGMIGQTFQDLTDPNHPQHDPNALESGIMDAAFSKPVQSLQANYNQAVTSGLFMQPVRAAMESLGVGRQHGETNDQLHQRYNQAVDLSRQQANQQAQANTIGSYGPGASIGDRTARLIQQVGNVGAGIVANPQYFLLPAMGAGSSSLLGGAAVAGVGNAGVAGASDAAAQMMDIAEGQKKDFDIEANLKQALVGGAFGAALHGAVEVSSFIKGLFGERGMDTTPAANPNLNIQPMTTDHVAMNAADHTQYQQLLAHGSVDDIKSFFRGRQGPQPSWSDVNTWVEHRDGSHPESVNGQPGGPNPEMQPDFNYQEEYNNHAEQQWREGNRQAVEQHVQSQMSGWKNAPDVEVVHGPEDIADPKIRQEVLKQDPNGNALGLFGSDGKAHIFSGRITDPEAANAVLFHEGLGHFGLAEKFGDRLTQTMQTLYDRNVGQFKGLADAYRKANPGASTALAMEEVLAEHSQKGQLKPSWKAAVGSAIKQFGRKMGLNLAYSDGEITHILAMGHDAVVNGHPSARANSFRGAIQNLQDVGAHGEINDNKFMFTGPKANDFDPNHPSAHITQDFTVRNEISDKDARMFEHPGDTLGATIHHPDLFEQYPELYGMRVKHEFDAHGSAGGYDPARGKEPATIYVNHASMTYPLDTVLHEVQHAIQDIEQYPEWKASIREGGTSNSSVYSYRDHPLEKEAFQTERRAGWTDEERQRMAPKFMRTDALGNIKEDPEHLDEVDRLKADPRYWQDREFRQNVNELARVRETQATGLQKFMFTGQKAKSFDPRGATSFNGQDGIRRNEISDDTAKIKNPAGRTLGAILDHPQLYEEYPELRDMPIIHDSKVNGGELWAKGENPDMPERHLKINPQHISRTMILHEVQHAIQDIEQFPDWARAIQHGGTMTDPKYTYDQHPSELEARITELRKDLTHDERVQYNSDPDAIKNKFITKAQLRASEPGYQSDDLETIYRALGQDYTKSTRSWEEERKAALKAGFSASQIKALHETQPGELSNRLYRMQAAANMADIKIAKLNEKLDTPDWSEKDQADYIKTLADRSYLIARVKGERGELARALRVSQAVRSYGQRALDEVGEQLAALESGIADLAADPTTFMKFAKNVKAMMNQGNTKGAHEAILNVNNPKWEQYLNTFHMNMLLSAFSTHVKAPIDMATGITRNVIEKVIAMPIGQVRQMYEGMTGKKPTPGVETAELANHIIGIMKAVSDAEVYRAMWTAVKSGNSSYVVNGQRTPTNFANQFGALSNPRIPGISKMTDLISAQDTFFRSVEMNSQLLTVATREARAQLGPKASTTDVMTLGHSLAANPTYSMIKEAFGETQRTLLLNDNPLNSMINKARTYRPNMTAGERAGAFLATNLAPFIRVESNNLINRIIQRSPLAFLDGYTREQLKAGGAKADIAMSKIMYGTVLLGMYWMAADKAKNYLTGEGPNNVDKFKQAEAGGWQPNAVHENGRYNTGGQLGMSVNPFDMHNKTAQMVASARQGWEEGNKSNAMTGLLSASQSIFHNLSEMSWVSDFQPLVDAMTSHGTEQSGRIAQFAANSAKTWLPNGLNQAARMTDVQRDTSGPNYLGNVLQSAVPGLREGLPIKYSVYGTPLPTGASLTGVHTWIPELSGNGTTETTDPTERELDRLNFVTPDHAVVTPVQHSFKNDDGTTRKLSPAEFEQYQQAAGLATVDGVRQEMNAPGWATMSDQERVELVKSIESDKKAQAREELFGQ